MANTTTLSSRFQIYIPKVLTGVECRPLIVGDINMLARRSTRLTVKRLSILTPDRRAKLTPLSGTAEVVPVANRGDPRGFV